VSVSINCFDIFFTKFSNIKNSVNGIGIKINTILG
jgi:hypothetical protein